jgi:predicted nucleotidyltransferase
MSVKIVDIPELIAIKRKAGRAQDLEDIKALKKLQ